MLACYDFTTNFLFCKTFSKCFTKLSWEESPVSGLTLSWGSGEAKQVTTMDMMMTSRDSRNFEVWKQFFETFKNRKYVLSRTKFLSSSMYGMLGAVYTNINAIVSFKPRSDNIITVSWLLQKSANRNGYICTCLIINMVGLNNGQSFSFIFSLFKHQHNFIKQIIVKNLPLVLGLSLQISKFDNFRSIAFYHSVMLDKFAKPWIF